MDAWNFGAKNHVSVRIDNDPLNNKFEICKEFIDT